MPELRKWTRQGGLDWTNWEAAVVSSMVCGSQWTQNRLFATGFADFQWCQACGGASVGTVGHRLFHCQRLSLIREQFLEAPLVHEARADLIQNPEHPLRTCGLIPNSKLPRLKAIEPERWHYFRNTSQGILTGHIYTDGRMKARWWWTASQRAGWGIAMMNGRRLITGICGHSPGPIQTVPRAELAA